MRDKPGTSVSLKTKSLSHFLISVIPVYVQCCILVKVFEINVTLVNAN